MTHATSATTDRCRYMLADSAHIQEKDVEFILKRKGRRKAIGVADNNNPLPAQYTSDDVRKTMPLLEAAAYHEPVKIDELQAGHILGSAVTLLKDKSGAASARLLFTGDLGRPGAAILAGREPAPQAEYLIMESTYGDGVHPSANESEWALAELISNTIKRGGHIVVPAFAVGSTQQLVLMIHDLVERNAIPQVPLAVDSPLAVDVAGIFERHLDEPGSDAAAYIKQGKYPFGFRQLRYLHEADDSKTLNDLRLPYVVISPSGMCEGGRVLHHRKNSVEEQSNLILVTGYQAVSTMGRRIVKRQSEIRVFGEPLALRAQVALPNELSAHADQREPMEWVQPIAKTLKAVFLVHGEGAAQGVLAELLTQQLGLSVVSPERGSSAELA